MTTQEKLIKGKMNLLELAEYLKNVSEACRVTGVSRQHFYDIQKAYEEGGLAALREKSRRKPNLRNRAAPEVEEAVIEMAEQQPAYGQVRVSNELRKNGILISPCGVRSIWLMKSNTPRPRPGIRRRKAAASDSTRRCWMSFEKLTFRRKIYSSLEELQDDLDRFMADYN